MVVVDLALATICFMGACHPALVGDATPAGIYTLSLRPTTEPGYGGDLMVFREDDRSLWAIHRVIAGRPGERRFARLHSARAADRKGVTAGCINIAPQVYRQLAACCDADVLVIVEAPEE